MNDLIGSLLKSPDKLAKMIDHTNVKGDTTQSDIKKLCREAIKYGFSCACVTPTNVKLAKSLLNGSDVDVCVVVGFPAGVQSPKTKAFESHEAISNGASEIDMVMNIGALKSGMDELVREEIKGVVEASDGNTVKVILETALLNDEEKVRACLIAKDVGADYVKTSTAYGGLSGATVGDIKLIRKTIGSEMKIKAAGGIRDLKTALEMIEAGANKIGTSAGVQIIEELIQSINE